MHEERGQETEHHRLLRKGLIPARDSVTDAALDFRDVECVSGRHLARNRGELVENPLGLWVGELDSEQDVHADADDGQRHDRPAEAGIGISEWYQCTRPVMGPGDNGAMDQPEPTDDFQETLSRLLDELESADPADAPEIAARVADTLHQQLR